MPLNPIVSQFQRKLELNTATTADRSGLERFIKGQRATDEDRSKGQELLAQYDALGHQAAMGGLQRQAQAQVQAQVRGQARGQAPGQARGHARPQHPAGNGARGPRHNAQAASPETLGSAFHNPYTFIHFPSDPDSYATAPTLLSADESDKDRFTGILRVRVRALSPVLSCEPRSSAGDNKARANAPAHRKALRCGGRLIIPATGIRGALRNLMVVLTGGRLDADIASNWLCQGRDTQLGPRGEEAPEHVPLHCFLARVESTGTATRPGRVELNALGGQNSLVAVERLGEHGIDLQAKPRLRPTQGGHSRGVVNSHTDQSLLIKLSGWPVNPRNKHEGLYKGSNRYIDLPPSLWVDYANRHRHADFGELQKGDLVWLQHRDPRAADVTDSSDVVSIQWSRWGRTGKKVSDLLGAAGPRLCPQNANTLDLATNLFGCVDGSGDRPSRAGRIRPDNLVFDEKSETTEEVELAVLAQPHPGCLAFYRNIQVPDGLSRVSASTELRGYKLYRTTDERGEQAPWLYKNQGIYDNRGQLRPFGDSPLMCRCDLINEGSEGTLTLSLRSLSRKELSVVLAMCGVDWRLGGGKPLGLGHCRPTHVQLHDEMGNRVLDWRVEQADSADANLDRLEPTPVPASDEAALRLEPLTEFKSRLRIYQCIQRPVKKLRYPRLQVGAARGGHLWFQRLASPRKNPPGLAVLTVTGELQRIADSDTIRAQALPPVDPDRPGADALFGHDVALTKTGRGERATYDLANANGPGNAGHPGHGGGPGNGGNRGQNRGPQPQRGPQGQNRNTREAQRRQRER